ncbi:hypothetical protein V2J09_004254 [Rumex salicifolius]
MHSILSVSSLLGLSAPSSVVHPCTVTPQPRLATLWKVILLRCNLGMQAGIHMDFRIGEMEVGFFTIRHLLIPQQIWKLGQWSTLEPFWVQMFKLGLELLLDEAWSSCSLVADEDFKMYACSCLVSSREDLLQLFKH